MSYIIDYILELNYYTYLKCIGYINLLLTCKKFYYNKLYNNDMIYKWYLHEKYSKKFIILAKKIILYQYLFIPKIINYRELYIKFFIFEKNLSIIGIVNWDENSYYNHWKNLNYIIYTNNENNENNIIDESYELYFKDYGIYSSQLNNYQNRLKNIENKINRISV